MSSSRTPTRIISPTRSRSRKRTGAHFVAIVELANVLDEQGIEDVSDPNLGGTVEFDWGWVKLVPAWHTSTVPGRAIGRSVAEPEP